MVPMSTPTTSEPALLDPPEAAAFGPLEFEEFFEREHAGLYGGLVLMTRDRHEAEELMQDAFLKVWERWGRIAAMEDPVGYLYRTAMNLFRSRKRRAALALHRVAHPREHRDHLREVEEREATVRALAPLTRRQRAAVVLGDAVGLTSEEAGGAPGVT